MQAYLISYDITDNNQRYKTARLLLRAGLFRVQKSVFIGSMSDQRYLRLQAQLQLLEQQPRWSANDQLLLLPLHQYTEDNLQTIGTKTPNWDLIYRRLHTLIL
ncbi:MAG: CRISPR-associated endonuclease Cas2 [Bacteroidota bacterium]